MRHGMIPLQCSTSHLWLTIQSGNQVSILTCLSLVVYAETWRPLCPMVTPQCVLPLAALWGYAEPPPGWAAYLVPTWSRKCQYTPPGLRHNVSGHRPPWNISAPTLQCSQPMHSSKIGLVKTLELGGHYAPWSRHNVSCHWLPLGVCCNPPRLSNLSGSYLGEGMSVYPLGLRHDVPGHRPPWNIPALTMQCLTTGHYNILHLPRLTTLKWTSMDLCHCLWFTRTSAVNGLCPSPQTRSPCRQCVLLSQWLSHSHERPLTWSTLSPTQYIYI